MKRPTYLHRSTSNGRKPPLGRVPKLLTLSMLVLGLAAHTAIIDASSRQTPTLPKVQIESDLTLVEDDIFSLLNEVKPHNRLAPSGMKYATLVPGREGFVFAPGRAHIMANILDVRGFPSGVKARDPETGQVFFVP